MAFLFIQYKDRNPVLTSTNMPDRGHPLLAQAILADNTRADAEGTRRQIAASFGDAAEVAIFPDYNEGAFWGTPAVPRNDGSGVVDVTVDDKIVPLKPWQPTEIAFPSNPNTGEPLSSIPLVVTNIG